MLNGPISPMAERMLDVTARRQEALSSNLANLDTPGYKAKDVAFQEELSSSSLRLAATNPAHLSMFSSPSSSDGASVQMVDSDEQAKANGNNVDLDHQMMEMSKNGMQYVMLIQYLGSSIKTLRASINEGSKG